MSFATPYKGSANGAVPGFTSVFDREIRQLILERTGIVVQAHQVANLYDTVANAMKQFGHAQSDTFMASLRATIHESPELEYLVAGITVGESYFFRDTGQIEFLRHQYLPQLIAKRQQTDRHLRIWSAGCSEGQELYTLALLLRDLIPDLDNWRLQLLGTDINNKNLFACMQGHYREWSFRNTPESIRNQYFHNHDGSYELHPDVRSMARFNYLNLAEDAFPSLLTDTNAIDLILCRNVFIYFDQATVDKVLNKFVQCLVPNGVLMVGASDLVNNNVPGLELIQDDNFFYYRRPIKQSAISSKKITTSEPVQQHTPVSVTEHKIDLSTSIPAFEKGKAMQQLHDYLAQENWQAVDETVDHILTYMDKTSELLVYKATAAANLGNLEQASYLCQQALELDSINKHAHFLSAIVQMELEQTKSAEASLRKVLFLDTKFLEAHYQLGLLHLRCGNQVQGLRSLKNALQLAEQGNPDYNLHGAPDTSYQRMAEVLRNEIQLHESTTNTKIHNGKLHD